MEQGKQEIGKKGLRLNLLRGRDAGFGLALTPPRPHNSHTPTFLLVAL